jgi:hypothetical protein
MAHLSVEPASIEQMLRNGGWPCDRIAGDTWRSHIRTRRASFPFFVKIDPAGYICFAIVPFLRSPEAQPISEKLYRKLLDLNQSLLTPSAHASSGNASDGVQRHRRHSSRTSCFAILDC